jgi:hypothetical protein
MVDGRIGMEFLAMHANAADLAGHLTTADSQSPPSLFQRVWPVALLFALLAVTVQWTFLLGYLLVKLVF